MMSEEKREQNIDAKLLKNNIEKCHLCNKTMDMYQLEQEKGSIENGDAPFTILDGMNVLLVNDERTLYQSIMILKNQTSVAIDLEGKLGKNGEIVLLQAGCSDN